MGYTTAILHKSIASFSYQAGWSSSNVVDWCLGGARFEFRAGHQPYCLNFSWFPQSLQTNSGEISRLDHERFRQIHPTVRCYVDQLLKAL
jgi:hypothetical protein